MKECKKGKRTQGRDWACRRSRCSWPNQALWACRSWRVPPWNSPSPPVTGAIRNSQRDRRFSDDHKSNHRCNRRTRFRHRALSLSLSLSKETKIDARVWWIPLLRERFGMGLEFEVWSWKRRKRNISTELMRRYHVSAEVRFAPWCRSFADHFWINDAAPEVA